MAILEEEELKSYDSDLITLIGELDKELVHATTLLEEALITVTKKVAEKILHQDAILLPDARDMLLNYLQKKKHADQVSGKYLFSYLKQRLSKHLACCTRIRSVGTILYRKGGDLMTTITNLLFRQRKQPKEKGLTSEPPIPNQQESFDQLLERVCTHMNNKLHQQAREIIANSKAGKMDLTQLDIDNFIASTDPCIWKMLLLLTRSVRDASMPMAMLTASNNKKLHCFYLLCVLLFTTNNQCNTPVHITLTDLLDSHIGNSEKIRILNRFGAVASPDTHARYRQSIVQQTKERGNKELLKKFAVLSMDNIDYLQSHAAVYSGDQHRSWHGTTIQAVLFDKSQEPTSLLAQLAAHSGRTPHGLFHSSGSLSPVHQTASACLSHTGPAVIHSHSSGTLPQAQATSLSHSGTTPLLVNQSTSLSHKGTNPSLANQSTSLSHTGTNPSLVNQATSLSHTGTNPSLVNQATSLSRTGTNPSLVNQATSLSRTGTNPSLVNQATSLSHTGLTPSLVNQATNLCHSGFTPLLVSQIASLSHAHLTPILVNQPACLSHSRETHPQAQAATLFQSDDTPSQAACLSCSDLLAHQEACLTAPDSHISINRKRRARTENEYGNADKMYGYKVHVIEAKAPLSHFKQHQGHSITHYNHSPLESDAFAQHRSKLFSYLIARKQMCDLDKSIPQLVTKGLQGYLSYISGDQSVESSDTTYLRVMDQNADSPETILEALSWLHHEFEVGKSIDLIVTGDAKTYLHMTTLKQQYGEALQWLITFPGDFHLLKNYQEVLMTAYWDAGLRQIASASGYRGETLTSLSKCSNFSTTTTFFFEVWEALYQHMLKVYNVFIRERKTTDTDQLCSASDGFTEFLNEKASNDENWKFWIQFVLRDCMAFISLYLAMRSNDWNLRIASLKDMAPIFFMRCKTVTTVLVV